MQISKQRLWTKLIIIVLQIEYLCDYLTLSLRRQHADIPTNTVQNINSNNIARKQHVTYGEQLIFWHLDSNNRVIIKCSSIFVNKTK